jgi:hypothetical protein
MDVLLMNEGKEIYYELIENNKVKTEASGIPRWVQREGKILKINPILLFSSCSLIYTLLT